MDGATQEKEQDALKSLVDALIAAPDRNRVLRAHPRVKAFYESAAYPFLFSLSQEEERVVSALAAIGQAEHLFAHHASEGDALERFKELVRQLLPVERFYYEIGGIVGYQWKVVRLMRGEEGAPLKARFHRPRYSVIAERKPDVEEAVLAGIAGLPEIAEIYPVGGAADRLRLYDERSGVPLPAACLPFCETTLLEGLIRDLQAREYLHYKLFGKQVTTPVALMTSEEKDNDAQVGAICIRREWFGRPQESFRFFCQPSVPAVDRQGNWCLRGPFRPLFKPSGHGVIWKLARDESVFDWFFSLGRKKALVRQINNPIASVDHGLLAFCGLGLLHNRVFGFASCPRHVKASEGTNVLMEKEGESGRRFVLTNIEYCDFKKFSLVDEPVEAGSIYSKFPSNTNILFADLEAVQAAVSEVPLPGMLVNFKRSSFLTEKGERVELEMGRLESTMQNIADSFDSAEEEGINTYLTYNERHKTISTIKREFVLGSSLLETAEGCFIDILKNACDLLVNECGFTIPEIHDPAAFFARGPSFIFLYHPALGPLYSIIRRKLRRGVMKRGSELNLQIAEVDIEGLHLEGSLSIVAEAVMGHREGGVLRYSERSGKCVLKNVTIHNEGIDWEASNVFWRGEIARKESLRIEIKGDGEFYAEGVTIEGGRTIVVHEGERVVAEMREGTLELRREPLAGPSWFWEVVVEKKKVHPTIEVHKREAH